MRPVAEVCETAPISPGMPQRGDTESSKHIGCRAVCKKAGKETVNVKTCKLLGSQLSPSTIKDKGSIQRIHYEDWVVGQTPLL